MGDDVRMTRPTARVLALLELLQAGGTHPVGRLADRLGVDERTVRRYVDHLVDLEVPVESVRGRYGGIRLVPGHRMPPLMLTGDEAVAVLLGLVVGRRSGLVPASLTAIETASAKLRRVLPRALADRVEALLAATRFTAAAHPSVPPPTDTLLVLAEAARDHRPVQIRYRNSQDVVSDRVVQPYGVVAHAGRWYVSGADSSSGQVRSFRVDRVAEPRPLAGTFDVPAGFDPAAALLSGLAAAPHRYEVTVLVAGPAAEVRRLFPPGLATVEDDHDGTSPSDADRAPAPGWVRVQMQVEQLDWVPGLLAGLGRPFVVEGPDQLRPLVRALAERLTAAAAT